MLENAGFYEKYNHLPGQSDWSIMHSYTIKSCNLLKRGLYALMCKNVLVSHPLVENVWS